MDHEQRDRLANNIAAAMQGVPRDIIERQLGLFEKVDPEYAGRVRNALQATVPS
jgi:catalase